MSHYKLTQDAVRAVSPLWLVAVLMIGVVPEAPAATSGVSALKSHDTEQPIDISADRLEVRSKDDVAVFEGRVEAVQKDLTLKSDRVTVYYQTKSGKTKPSGTPSTISRIDAAGNVQLETPSEQATANWGVYDMEKRILTLGGSVVLNRGDVVVRGDRLQVDLDSGVTKLDTADAGTGGGQGRVRGRFVPAEKTGGGS